MRTKQVHIGKLGIGKGNPVRVESMLKVPLSNRNKCEEQLNQLYDSGCELVRIAFPDIELKQDLKHILDKTRIPIMADIHFDHKLAIAAIETGCPAIRINPGNMGSSLQLNNIIEASRQNNVVLRIGANSGSISNRQLKEANGDISKALFIAVKEQFESIEKHDFHDVILSAKSTNVQETLKCNYLLSRKYPEIPFHIGITEAGPGLRGIVKSSSGLSLLLNQGIGDTLRVSLTGDPCQEIEVGYELLRSCGLRDHGPELISCPTCGRKRTDVRAIVDELEPLIKRLPDGFKFAVMGCEVNGPREARSADLGIAGKPEGVVIFKKGIVVGEYSRSEIKSVIGKIIDEIMEVER